MKNKNKVSLASWRVPMIKTIPAKDSWNPCFDEVRENNDRCGTFISGNVEVRMYTEWLRISIMGADDTIMEKFFQNVGDMVATWNALDQCPTQNALKEWGFQYS
jgi:hypothetical protein